MSKRRIIGISLLVPIFILGAFGLAFSQHVFAQQPSAKPADVTHASAVKSHGAVPASVRTIDPSSIPQASPAQVKSTKAIPYKTFWDAQKYAQIKANASKPNPAVASTSAINAVPPLLKSTDVPNQITHFTGQSENGWVPSDMGMSSGDGFEVQAINESIAVYNESGTIQSGWPKTAQAFFGVSSSFSLFDPRVIWDPDNGGHFWMEFDDAFSTAHHSYYDIAVSKTANPTGAWWFYQFDFVDNQNATNEGWADFPMMGIDSEAVYLTGNHFCFTSCNFLGSFIFWVNKTTMEAGTGSPTGTGYLNDLNLNDGLAFTIAPAISFGAARAEMFASVDFNASNVYTIFTVSNPLFLGSSGEGWWSYYQYTNRSWTTPPAADQPGGAGTIDSGDSRISTNPVWRAGILSFAFNSGITEGATTVPGIIFLRIVDSLSDGTDTPCYPSVNRCVYSTLVYALENGQINYTGADVYYPAIGADTDNNLIFTYDYSSTSRFPSAVVYSRRSTETRNVFGAAGATYALGSAFYSGGRWGDYSAAAIDPTSTGSHGTYKIWVAGDFADGAGLWSTELTSVSYGIGDI